MNCQYYNAVTSHSLCSLQEQENLAKMCFSRYMFHSNVVHVHFISLKILEVKDYHTGS